MREALLHAFGPLAQGPGFEELIPGSAMLTALASGEQPLPNVQYHSFGGSNPVFVKFYVSELGHAVYLVSAVGSFLVERLAQLPGVASAYGGLAELLQGDSAVGLASSHWPDGFSGQHQELHYNHMQALVDPAVQQAVLPLLQD